MYWCKKSLLNRGYVMIYTLIISLIIISIFGYIFTIEAKRKLCILDSSKDISEKLYNKETNDYLFSKMNDYIVSNLKDINKNSVHNFFEENPSNNKIGNEEYYICYSTGVDKFLLYEPYGNNDTKIDEYDYNFQNGKINYIYDYTRYE
jgi:hypothetical protein